MEIIAPPQTRPPRSPQGPLWALICVIFLTLSFFFIKLQVPVIAKRMFDQGQKQWLVQISGGEQDRSWGYYHGMLEENVTGPASQAVAASALALLCFLLFPGVSFRRFAVCVLLFLIVTKWEVLFFPPYGDAIGGPFAEAIWLKRHHFDYPGLLNQPGYILGGPRVYFFSLYPGLLALLMTVLPNSSVFLFVNHLIVFLCAAVMIAALRDLLRTFLPDDQSSLCAVTLLFLPIFQVQTEAINMELPGTFLIFMSAYFMAKKDFHWAGLAAAVAVLIKGTALMACAGYFLCALIYLFSNDGKNKKNLLIWALVLALLAMGKGMSKFLVNDQHVVEGIVRLGGGWKSIHRIYITYFYLGSLAVFLLSFFGRRDRPGKQGADRWVLTVMFVYAAMWFLLFLNFRAVSPRYRVAVYPMLVFCCAWSAFFLLRNRALRIVLLSGVLLLAGVSSYGLFFGAVMSDNHVLMERSLEYRNDLILHQRLARRVEEQYSDLKIGSPFLAAQALALPELGYVNKDLDVMIYGFRCQYGGIEEFAGLKGLNPARTVYVANKLEKFQNAFSYPFGPHDKIIEVIEQGDKTAWLFMGGVALDTVYKLVSMMNSKK